MDRPLRALHVVSRMDRGGVETWLMHVLRHIDRHEVALDFIVNVDRDAAYDEEIRALGGRILRCPHPLTPSYARRFQCLLARNGPYDIVHSHLQSFSGYILRLAHKQGAPVRIAHSHTDTRGAPRRGTLWRKVYVRGMAKWLNRYATVKLAISNRSAACLYGSNWECDPRCRILYYGVDLSPFQHTVDRAAVRAEIGVPQEAVLIAHAGRFIDAKNHTFVVDVAREILSRYPHVYFVMLGEGPLRQETMQKVTNLGLEQRVLFTGVRADVGRILLAADGFLFPSLYEGLGLALVEAQAAGLPCLCSERIPEEATVIPELVQRLCLSAPAAAWADRIMAAVSRPRAFSTAEAIDRVERSRFNLQSSVNELKQIYFDAVATANCSQPVTVSHH